MVPNPLGQVPSFAHIATLGPFLESMSGATHLCLGTGAEEAQEAVVGGGQQQAAVGGERERVQHRIARHRKRVRLLEGAHVPHRQLPRR